MNVIFYFIFRGKRVRIKIVYLRLTGELVPDPWQSTSDDFRPGKLYGSGNCVASFDRCYRD